MDSGRKPSDKRPETRTLRRGTEVGIYHNGKVVYGTVYDVDTGGWIYVHWSQRPYGLNEYLRATQVFLTKGETYEQ